MGLRVSWDVPNIFEYFVNTHKDLRAARDRFLGPYQNPSQEDKIELGRLFDHLLNEDREAFTEKVEEILSGYCRGIKRNKCRNESEVMSPWPAWWGALPRRVSKRACSRRPSCSTTIIPLIYNGPWAPHNFVELDLRR